MADRLPEQRAIIHLLWSRDLSGHVQIVPPAAVQQLHAQLPQGDFLSHFLDMRLKWMRQHE